MRKILASAFIVFIFSLTGYSQDTPKFELFGGYSYARTGGQDSSHLNGFNISLTTNATKSFGVVLDFGGLYRPDNILTATTCGLDQNCTQQKIKLSQDVYTFMTGPKFAYRNNSRVTPFVQTLLGAYRISGEFVSKINFGNPATFDKSRDINSSFAAALGGGIDIKLHKNVALRAIQADYLYLRNLPKSNNARLSSGLVFRF
jgi:opacity protein-like surface antigen